MRIETGKGTMSLMTLLAIWSISLVVNLPGLAISPILANLTLIFPHTSQLEIQLLTILPNLIIIPFVLISGKLSESGDKVRIVVVALTIYLFSGILYFFANTMVDLIVISCLLGLACGLLIPLSAGLLADAFTGKYRMQQLGIKSGIANISVVFATLVVGSLADISWHLAFLVYLIPLVPLALAYFLSELTETVKQESDFSRSDNLAQQVPQTGTRVVRGFILWRLLGIMSLYFSICYFTIIISYYLPFLMQHHSMGTTELGVVTALFFLAIFVPGLILPTLLRTFKQDSTSLSIAVIALGLFVMAWSSDVWTMGLASVLMGFGFGVLQPLIYDKAVECATYPRKVTLALSFILAVNYLAVTLTPFIVDAVRSMVGTESNSFPFLLNGFLALVVVALSLIFRRGFVFRINQEYMS
ncbi:MAG: MFS transporter [Mucinivorans sp.]